MLAHVDAGKTSLTERLLYESGALDTMGRVDAGTTRTDSMELERRRGITIRAAVTALRLGDLDVNLIDTPGHSDFIAEVERSLAVLDAAVLVLSAVEGVQPQTVILWRALRHIGIPTVLFINKVDRRGADVDRVLAQIRERLSRDLVVHTRLQQAGTGAAHVSRVPLTHDSVVEPIIEADDDLLREWIDERAWSGKEVLFSLRTAVASTRLFPVVYGSAITGTGIDELRWALANLLPVPSGEQGDPVGIVFAVDRDQRSRRAWMRLWQGRLHVRDKVSLSHRAQERITHIALPTPEGLRPASSAASGDILAIRGLTKAQIGDTLGTPQAHRTPRIAPPTLQTVVRPVDPAQRTAMFAGLVELADEDPLIGLEFDGGRGEATVRIHGEVQKEVIGALLHDRFHVEVCFEDTSVACIETVMGTGEATEHMGLDGNPYLATIGLRIEADDSIDGLGFSPGNERGNLPPAFITACEEGTRAALRQGLSGWPVTGCRITMTASGYAPRQSHAHQKFNKGMSSVSADFRNLAPVVVMDCLRQAGTRVCEPVERFDLELPSRHLNVVMAALGRLGASAGTTVESGLYTRVGGSVASARVAEFTQSLPNLTAGEGVLTTQMDHYAPVLDPEPPRRDRTGCDPLDRATWFRSVPR
ncbi:GTP-binding protein [Streptomyces sp. NPDC001142]